MCFYYNGKQGIYKDVKAIVSVNSVSRQTHSAPPFQPHHAHKQHLRNLIAKHYHKAYNKKRLENTGTTNKDENEEVLK